MFEVGRYRTDRGTVAVAATERIDGDVHPLGVDRTTLRARQASLTSRPWRMLDETHGVACVEVPPTGEWYATCGVGDVLVTRQPIDPIAVWVADCAPVILIGRDGTVVGVHAGWRGLAAGIIDIGVDTVEARGTDVVAAVVGPCIRQCCYEFGGSDLRSVASGIGVAPNALDATTTTGRMALDMPTAAIAALERRDIHATAEGSCTGCDDRFFSHRARGDVERHALVAMMEQT